MYFRRELGMLGLMALAFIDGFLTSSAFDTMPLLSLGSVTLGAFGAKLIGALDLLTLVGGLASPRKEERQPYHSRR